MKKLLFLCISLIAAAASFFYFYNNEATTFDIPTAFVSQQEQPVHIEGKHLGYDFTKENLDFIPKHVPPPAIHLPDSVDYSSCMPPVGNQDEHSTCVTWAVAYYGLTGMHCLHDGMGMGGGPNNNQNQGSPSDLFMAIPAHLKSPDCKGTAFEPALNTLIHRGNAPLYHAAYDSIGTCDDQPKEQWDKMAHFTKMNNFRRIDLDVTSLKETLADKHLILFSAKITKELVQYDGGVFGRNFKRSLFNLNNQSGEHALLLMGYSEQKKAFKFVNSWGEDWGEGGYAWVDYDFFVDHFAHEGLFTMDFPTIEEQIAVYKAEQRGEQLADKTSTNCLHLTPWVLADIPVSGNDRQREVHYNIHNDHGHLTTSDNFKVLFLYVNAYDFSDFGLLYRTDLLKDGETFDTGEDLAQERGASTLSFTYDLPLITGKYYLTMLVEDEIVSDDPACHLFFASEKTPIEIVNGRALEDGKDYIYENEDNFNGVREASTKGKFYTRDASHPKQYMAEETTNRNAYTPAEIRKGLDNAMHNKQWQLLLEEYKMKNKGPCSYRIAYKEKTIVLTAPFVPNGEYSWYQSANQIDYDKITNADEYQYAFTVEDDMTYFRCDIKIPIADASMYSSWGTVKEQNNKYVIRSVCFVVEGRDPIGERVGVAVSSEGEDLNGGTVTISFSFYGKTYKGSYKPSACGGKRQITNCANYKVVNKGVIYSYKCGTSSNSRSANYDLVPCTTDAFTLLLDCGGSTVDVKMRKVGAVM